MTTWISGGIARKSALAAEIDANTLRHYRLRYDRLAGWLAVFSAALWALILLRAFVLLPGSLIALERTFQAQSPLLLVGLVALDGGIGLALLRGVGGARLAARLRAGIGIALCAAYYAATRDFMPALLLAALQGALLILLARKAGLLLAYPAMIWLGVFFVVPLFSIVIFSLGDSTALGTIDLSAPDLENYARIVQPVGRSGLVYLSVIARTIGVAFLTTVFCLVIGYPFAFWIARQPPRWRAALLMLVMIPFWTNLLIRTYAWLVILRRDGLINNVLIDVLGVISRPLELTNTPGALLLGLVYGYLPYMVLPLYASVERLDRSMAEAAGDLYADPWRAFWRVTLPLTMPGIVAGSILVFIPSVGTYVVTNVLGGGKIFLIGNLLEQQFLGSSGDKAFGAAFGVVLTVLMLIATMIYFRAGRKAGYT